MECEHTLTCSAGSVASRLPQDGLDTGPSGSARSTNGASASCDDTGQMSLFGETCGRSRGVLLHTPTGKANQLSPSMASRDAGSWGLTSSPLVTPASHSLSPGSDWARKMTATYGRKLGDYWLSSDPPDSWVKMLLGISTWASTTCWLTWKKSATPRGRWLFRLVPSTPRTGETGFGLWPTITENGNYNRKGASATSGDGLATAVKMWPTPTVDDSSNVTRKGGSESERPFSSLTRTAAQPGMKLNSAWVSRMMGYPDDWLTLDGEVTR